MERRGLTLVEVMVALAAMLVLGALAAPGLVRRLEATRLEAAAAQVEGVLLTARARAQRAGGPVRVEARAHGGERWGLYVVDLAVAESDGVLACVLPAGLLVGDRPRGMEAEAASRDGPIVLTTFAPDGSAIVADAIYLEDAGRALRVGVRMWSGLPEVEPVEPEASEPGEMP